MFELNEQQSRELASPEPVAVDPRTGERYVLVRKDVYDRVKGILGDEETDEDLRVLLARSLDANGWDEPEMADYDDYDAHRAKQC
jgi:hypothetical protein